MNASSRPAGLWVRFLALLIDYLIFAAVFFPVTRAVKGVWLMGADDHRWGATVFVTDPLCLTFLVAMLIYFVLLEGLFGATFGKWILGLRVVHVAGGRPGLTAALWRNLLRFVDGLPAFNIVGVIMILTSREKARFGDRVAKTRVLVGGR